MNRPQAADPVRVLEAAFRREQAAGEAHARAWALLREVTTWAESDPCQQSKESLAQRRVAERTAWRKYTDARAETNSAREVVEARG